MINSSTVKHIQGSLLLEGDVLNGDLSDVREGFICEYRGMAPGHGPGTGEGACLAPWRSVKRPVRQECVGGGQSGGR